jgi:toxin FitB
MSWMRNREVNQFYLSVLTIGEIQHGVSKLSANPERAANLQHWLRDRLIPEFKNRILGLDLDIAICWGVINAELRSRGIVVPTIDAQIAATAQVHGLPVVTRNVRHFEQCKVRTINPWE